ncbi:MAG TPA: single-stranded DNA-binding protein [Anaerolineae bacterium]|nr:single-stranded DNA-binding protein [Anaerolineae bacterium]
MFSKTIVVGHLGRDPELRFTPSGQQVCSFSVATSRSWTDQSGQPQEKTTWFRVTAWGKLGELCHQYLAKGRLVLVEGEIDASAWTAQTGEPRASLELNARNVRFLGGRDSAGGAMTARPSSPMEAPAMDEEDIPF